MDIKKMKSEFGERFKECRNKRKWSQERAAEIFGVGSKTTIQNWENGSDFPECARVLNIADVFGVPLDWLFGRDAKLYRPEKVPSEGEREALQIEHHPAGRKKAI